MATRLVVSGALQLAARRSMANEWPTWFASILSSPTGASSEPTSNVPECVSPHSSTFHVIVEPAG